MNISESVKLYILSEWNRKQDIIFKSGGITQPQFEKYEDLMKWNELVNDSFPPCYERFDSLKLEENGMSNIMFDIPPDILDKKD